MKQRIALALVFIVGCATGGVAAQLVVPPVRAGTAPTRWEYHCDDEGTTEKLTEALNEAGAAGWELAGLTTDHKADLGSFKHMYCTKRALP